MSSLFAVLITIIICTLPVHILIFSFMKYRFKKIYALCALPLYILKIYLLEYVWQSDSLQLFAEHCFIDSRSRSNNQLSRKRDRGFGEGEIKRGRDCVEGLFFF
jgi:hypothetical protein